MCSTMEETMKERQYEDSAKIVFYAMISAIFIVVLNVISLILS
jgi:hypothetical protein